MTPTDKHKKAARLPDKRRTFSCACAFAKEVEDKNPFNFPRVGMADNVLYRGCWILQHRITGQQAYIRRQGAGMLHAEADKCCFDWFDSTRTNPNE